MNLEEDLNNIFSPKLEALGRNPILKKKGLAKTIKIIFFFDICRLKNPKTKRFKFTQHHSAGLILKSLDYSFISNFFQEYFN